MCASINTDPVQTQIPLVCLQCKKLVILFAGLVFEVSNNAGVFFGYLHKHCFAEWEKKNLGTVVEPFAEP